jgi:predicted extracellular nuclease
VILGPRRAILIGAIAAVALTIIFLPIIFTINQPNFELVNVRLANVTISDADEQEMTMRVEFEIENPTDQTITTSRLDYELFANGVLVTPRTISYEDIPLNGRPAIFAGQTVPIPETFVLEFDDDNAEVYNMILENPGGITWSATGSAQVESSLTFVTRPIDNEI